MSSILLETPSRFESASQIAIVSDDSAFVKIEDCYGRLPRSLMALFTDREFDDPIEIAQTLLNGAKAMQNAGLEGKFVLESKTLEGHLFAFDDEKEATLAPLSEYNAEYRLAFYFKIEEGRLKPDGLYIRLESDYGELEGESFDLQEEWLGDML